MGMLMAQIRFHGINKILKLVIFERQVFRRSSPADSFKKDKTIIIFEKAYSDCS